MFLTPANRFENENSSFHVKRALDYFTKNIISTLRVSTMLR